jgi:hypothetical protein
MGPCELIYLAPFIFLSPSQLVIERCTNVQHNYLSTLPVDQPDAFPQLMTKQVPLHRI